MALVFEEEQRFMQAERDQQYVLREYDSLRKKYPDEYVGVVNGQVKYHSQSLDSLLAEIGTTKGVFVFFVPSKHRTVAV